MEAVIRLTDPEVEWMPHSGGGRLLRGYDELREFFGGLASEDTRVIAQADEYVSEGDAVIAHGRLRVESWTSVSDAELWWVFHMRAGRIIRAQAFTNGGDALASARSGASG